MKKLLLILTKNTTMKRLLLILLCLPMIFSSCEEEEVTTNTGNNNTGNNNIPGYAYVPDDNFEQAMIDLGFDNILDDYILLGSVNQVDDLDISNKNISDLTGIEHFNNLVELWAVNNQISTIDLTENSYLRRIFLSNNQITYLDVSSNSSLRELDCSNNSIQTLFVTENDSLHYLNCKNNLLETLDLRKNEHLELIEMDIRNNPNLYCVYVNNAAFVLNNWYSNANGYEMQFDPQHYFSEDCP